MSTVVVMESLVKTLIGLLKEMKTNEIPFRQHNLSEEVLETVFDIGECGGVVKEEDRIVIGPLIKDRIQDLDNCIFSIGLKFDPDRVPYYLILRSGIQFLLDDFKEFPVGEKQVLEDSLKAIQDSENLESFDEELSNYRDNPIFSDESMYYPESSYLRPIRVPETHKWWS